MTSGVAGSVAETPPPLVEEGAGHAPDAENAAGGSRCRTWLATEHGGMLLVLVAGMCYACQGVALHYLKGDDVPSAQVAWCRGWIQGIGIMIYSYVYNESVLAPRDIRAWVFGRACMGGLAGVMAVHALATLPIGDATSLVSIRPVVTVITARIFIGEKIKTLVAPAIVLSLFGVCLVTQPSFIFAHATAHGPINATATPTPAQEGGAKSWYQTPTAGYVSALSQALLSGAIIVIVRHTRAASTPQQLFPWSFTTIIVASATTQLEPFVFDLPPRVWLTLVGGMSCGIIGHFCMNFGARHASPGATALLRSTDTVWGYIFDVALFHREPSVVTVVGAASLVCAAALISYANRKKPSVGEKGGSFDAAAARRQVAFGDHASGDADSRLEESLVSLL